MTTAVLMGAHGEPTSFESALHQISTLLLHYICMNVATIGYHVPADSIIIPEIFQSWAHACMHAAPKNRPRGGSHQLAAENPLDAAPNGAAW